MKTSNKGITLIKEFESLHDGDLKKIGLQPKMCPAGLWTEGYGRLVLDNKGNRLSGEANKDKAYHFSRIKTEAQAESALREDLEERESMVNSLGLHFSQGQFDALVSFVYNVGFANLKSSTLLKKARKNLNDISIANEFAKWNKARVNGVLKVLPGLTRRRKAESDLYFSK
ncbi:lysozyme [Proteiniphilum sp.]|uniref:lysozyme n=1 Tax=Proteiniphilum sp. TaxID=1926877 RepID=UPI002B1FF796|nr:lysozyme [Proteiniphilum sp.]MEA4916540.1 lysozyme [Proteiniphilum sp.]MEA4948783.1 lysozyme [Petrimonas sp.]